MKVLHLTEDLKIEGNLKTGYVDLYDRGGNRHHHKALNVPGYGLVPCSKKLEDDFTTDAEQLDLIISEEDDENPPYTSDIWITLNNGDEDFDDLNEDEDLDDLDDEDMVVDDDGLDDDFDDLNEDEDIVPRDPEFEEFLATIDDPAEATELCLYHYSLSIDEYCEKYHLDFNQACVIEEANAILIPNPKKKTYKKLVIDERMFVWDGYVLESRNQVELLRILERRHDDVDGVMLDIGWLVGYMY